MSKSLYYGNVGTGRIFIFNLLTNQINSCYTLKEPKIDSPLKEPKINDEIFVGINIPMFW